MKLQIYLSGEDMSEAEFGKRVGVTQVAVHRYVVGQRIPTKEIMAKIFAATDGNVTPNTFFDVEAA